MKAKIPNWEGWMKSHSFDDGPVDPDIVELQEHIRRRVHSRKRQFTSWIRQGVLADSPIATYAFGPINLPCEPKLFTSSRWNERRTNIPLPHDRESWMLVHRYWKGSNSYRGIKTHIEQYGMRRPIFADMFVNYDPSNKKLMHRCFAWQGENWPWPVLILRTGNERIMMAMFEWDWITVPIIILARDCGFDPAMTAVWKLIHERSKIGGVSRDICRLADDKGDLDIGLNSILEGMNHDG